MWADRQRSIKSHLMLVILLTCCVTVFVVAAALSCMQYLSIKRQLIENLEITVSLISDNSSAALAFDDTERANVVLKSVKKNEAIKLACLYNDLNQTVAEFEHDQIDHQCPKDIDFGVFTHKNYVVIAEPIIEGSTSLGSIYIMASMTKAKQLLQKHVLYSLSIVIGVLIIISFPLATRLQKSISMPLVELADASKKLYLPPPKEEGIVVGLDVRNEIQLISHALKAAVKTLEQTKYELEKVNMDNLTLLVNNYISIRYITEEIKANREASHVLKAFFEGALYGEIPSQYMDVVDVSRAISDSLETSIVEIAKNISDETEILEKGRTYTDLKVCVEKAFNNLYPYGSKFLNLNFIESGDVYRKNYHLYEGAVVKMAENILLLFEVLKPDDHMFSVSYRIDEDKNEEKIIMEFYLEPLSQAGMIELNYDDEDIGLRLLNSKFFHNINNPIKDKTFIAELTENTAKIRIFMFKKNPTT